MIATEGEAREYAEKYCDSHALAKLDRFVELLTAETQRQNLIARSTIASVWVRHISDSLQLLTHVPRETTGWLDLGSGAGFPGIVTAIAVRSYEFTLVESRRKRIEWLEFVVRELELSNCRIEGSRVETMVGAKFDVISARAFADLEKTLHLASRFSKSNTMFLLPKGRSARQELNALPASMTSMFHVKQSITDAGAGIIVGSMPKGAG
ncbi:MAG: 16S rRNA (guanine(527)-N(7))-methyltransferase RsmG [Pontixanthobacter sp.]